MAIVLWNSICRWLVTGDHRRPSPHSRGDYDVVLIDVVRASEPRLPIRRCNGHANPKLPDYKTYSKQHLIPNIKKIQRRDYFS
jgi:hypothetical protein